MFIRKEIELQSGIIELTESGFIKMTYNDYTDIDLNETLKREAAVIELCEGKARPLLIIFGNKFITFNDESKRHIMMNSKIRHLKLAEALVIKGLGFELLAQNYIRNKVGTFPCQTFNNEKEASEWLSQHK